MALPQPVFVRDAASGEYRLTERAKKVLKDLLIAQEVSRFIDLVGYTPHPDDPYPPRPWPFPWPWPLHQLGGLTLSTGARNGQVGYPSPDDDGPWPPHIGPLIKEVLSNSLITQITAAKGVKGSLSIIEAMKHEGIAAEAFNELHDQLGAFQKSLAAKAKASA